MWIPCGVHGDNARASRLFVANETNTKRKTTHEDAISTVVANRFGFDDHAASLTRGKKEEVAERE